MREPNTSKEQKIVSIAVLSLLAVGPSFASVGAPPCEVSSASTCSSYSCTADSSWFNNGQPNVSNPAVDLPTSDPSQQTNCEFHQLAWQDFLYLMTPTSTPGVLNYDTWQPYYEVLRLATPADCGDAKLSLGLIAKTDTIHSGTGDIQQAGSDDPLIGQNGNYVHYDMRVNLTEEVFIELCDLWAEQCFALASNLDLPSGSTTSNEVGAIEIKAAWKIFNDGEDTSRYYTTTAAVQPVSPSDSSCAVKTVGLVGLHIVHKTPSHPEFIWATFEQVDNAPNCDNLSATPPAGSWSFYDQTQNCDTNKNCNTYVTGQATQVCRENTCGGGSEANSQNQCDIYLLNNSVHSQLASDSVWQNYYLTGAVWFNQADSSKPQTGSVNLANTTMETYTQSINCFTCHTQTYSNAAGQQQLDFSHIFDRIDKSSSSYCAEGLPFSCYTVAGSK